MTTISLARENLELEKRRRLSEQGRDHFYPFFKAAWPDIDQQSPYSDNWHIEAVCEHLEALYRRQIHRLVISIPPGHTKSTLSSVAFEAWVWTQSPEEKFFTTSYDKALAIRDTQRTRELINSAWYQHYYGDLFSWADDQNVKSYYKNTKGGYRLASSVAGGATGQRANIVTVDDPHNVMDAIKSIIEREAALHWWDAAMSSRINDQQNDCFLIIGQRVHPQDLIGHVLETGLYEYLRLPAEFEPTKKTFTSIGWSDPRTEEGEPLWKQKFPKEVLERLKMILKNEYYAQYQQSPNEDATSIIKSHWLLRFEETATHYLLHGKNGDRKVAKNKCQIVISNDLALSKNDQGCYVVFCTWALTPTYDLILLSVIREKFDAPETYEQIDLLWETYPRMMAFILEAVGYQSAVIQFSQQKGIPVIPYTPTIDKIARAKNISVYFANGQFFFPHFASWLADYEKEITEFPGTKYKDQMDATSIVQALFEFGKPTVKDLSYDIAMDIVREQFEKGNREAAEVMALKQLEKENGELARWLLEQET